MNNKEMIEYRIKEEGKEEFLTFDEANNLVFYFDFPASMISYLYKGKDGRIKSNIKVDNSILKLLPDDFIEKKKTIIMSMEDNNKLAVAMVNPNDKYTIREISLSTGRSLNVYCIPYFEYDQYLKEYFMQKKSEQAAKETETDVEDIEF